MALSKPRRCKRTLNNSLDSFFTLLGHAVTPCRKMVNKIKPGVVDERKLTRSRTPNTFQINQNLTLGIQGCKELGLVVVNVGAEDLRAGKARRGIIIFNIYIIISFRLIRMLMMDQRTEQSMLRRRSLCFAPIPTSICFNYSEDIIGASCIRSGVAVRAVRAAVEGEHQPAPRARRDAQ